MPLPSIIQMVMHLLFESTLPVPLTLVRKKDNVSVYNQRSEKVALWTASQHDSDNNLG